MALFLFVSAFHVHNFKWRWYLLSTPSVASPAEHHPRITSLQSGISSAITAPSTKSLDGKSILAFFLAATDSLCKQVPGAGVPYESPRDSHDYVPFKFLALANELQRRGSPSNWQ